MQYNGMRSASSYGSGMVAFCSDHLSQSAAVMAVRPRVTYLWELLNKQTRVGADDA